jgi:hypothetical protein
MTLAQSSATVKPTLAPADAFAGTDDVRWTVADPDTDFVAEPLDPSQTDTSYFNPTPADDAGEFVEPTWEDVQSETDRAAMLEWIAETADRRWDDYAAIVAAEDLMSSGLALL